METFGDFLIDLVRAGAWPLVAALWAFALMYVARVHAK